MIRRNDPAWKKAPYLQIRNFERLCPHPPASQNSKLFLHTTLLFEDERFPAMTDAQVGHLVKIWMLAARVGNKLVNNVRWITSRIKASQPVDLAVLCSGSDPWLEPWSESTESIESDSCPDLQTVNRTLLSDVIGRGSVSDVISLERELSHCCLKKPSVRSVDTPKSKPVSDDLSTKPGLSACCEILGSEISDPMGSPFKRVFKSSTEVNTKSLCLNDRFEKDTPPFGSPLNGGNGNGSEPVESPKSESGKSPKTDDEPEQLALIPGVPSVRRSQMSGKFDDRDKDLVARRVHAYWAEKCSRVPRRCRFNPAKHGAKIAARLDDGFTEQDCMHVVDACAASDFHMGRHEKTLGRPVNDFCANLFTSAERVAWWLERYEASAQLRARGVEIPSEDNSPPTDEEIEAAKRRADERWHAKRRSGSR